MPYSTNFSFDAIGTHWEIDLTLDKKREVFLLKEIKKRIDEFDKAYSRFRNDSLISTISKSEGTFQMPEDFELLFNVYKSLNAATSGLFTPLIGNTLEGLGYDKEYSLVPKNPQFPRNFQDVLTFTKGHLSTTHPVMLDFGAGGKGYLIDIIGDLLHKEGVEEYLIDAGGDILHKSNSKDEIKIGLENPLDLKQVIGVSAIRNKSICGSAGNRRAWQGMHHIINPVTLVSPDNVLAVWVVADTALVADAMSTALFLSQDEKVKTAYPCDYFILYKDLTFDKSKGFDAELFIQ